MLLAAVAFSVWRRVAPVVGGVLHRVQAVAAARRRRNGPTDQNRPRPDDVLDPDRTRFAAFYQKHARPLWAYLSRATGSAADADDLVQEAFCRLLARGPVESAELDQRRFLFRVASNLVVDRWRGRRDDRIDTDVSVDDLAGSPERQPDPELGRTLAALPRRDRALLWLAHVEGQSHADIAAAFKVGRASVKVLLFRARRRLRDLLIAKGYRE